MMHTIHASLAFKRSESSATDQHFRTGVQPAVPLSYEPPPHRGCEQTRSGQSGEPRMSP